MGLHELGMKGVPGQDCPLKPYPRLNKKNKFLHTNHPAFARQTHVLVVLASYQQGFLSLLGRWAG